MKLRTELIFGKHYDANAFINGSDDEIARDAIAAHALMQAMEELQPNILCDAIQQRADELMREWTSKSEV